MPNSMGASSIRPQARLCPRPLTNTIFPGVPFRGMPFRRPAFRHAWNYRRTLLAPESERFRSSTGRNAGDGVLAGRGSFNPGCRIAGREQFVEAIRSAYINKNTAPLNYSQCDGTQARISPLVQH